MYFTYYVEKHAKCLSRKGEVHSCKLSNYGNYPEGVGTPAPPPPSPIPLPLHMIITRVQTTLEFLHMQDQEMMKRYLQMGR